MAPPAAAVAPPAIVRLGFFTACLPRLPLDDLAGWAAAHGFDALEVAAWPRAGGRDFT